jgi:hypothetical protein
VTGLVGHGIEHAAQILRFITAAGSAPYIEGDP